VDREREHVGCLVDAEVVPLQRAALVRADEGDPDLAAIDTLRGQDAAGMVGRSILVDVEARAVLDLDLDQRVRCVPVASACVRYASTIRWTSLCRTTSAFENSTNEIPSIFPRMSRTVIRPEAWCDGRSTWGTSPVTTTFEPNPSLVRNICICSGLVFWASSRMMKESFSVRPRMKASGATSTM